MPQFKAQPLPDFDTVVLPEKKKLEATKPEPFRLLVDQRGAMKSTRLEKMVRAASPTLGLLPGATFSFTSQKGFLELSGERRTEAVEAVHRVQGQAQCCDS